jgi:hypothetical protein
MAGPIAATGAISNPTRYGALTMGGEQFTGLWTQRSPYRDAATAYLMKKFYQGSRFDSIWDGINREISCRLTDIRRPGSAVYNTNTFNPVLGFYSFKYISNGNEIVRVMVDTATQVQDGTAGGQITLLNKLAGAGKMRFLALGSTLYMSDGVETKKWIAGSTGWVASTVVTPGTLIVIDPNHNMQMALGGITMNIQATASNGSVVTIYFDPQTVTNQFANLQGVSLTFSGLTAAGTYLNGNSYTLTMVSSTLGIATISLAHAAYAITNDTGSTTTGSGITGGTAPAWSSTQYAITPDAGQQWKCYGSAVQAMGLPTPPAAPTITPLNGTQYWQPVTALFAYYGILDANQNVEWVYSGIGGGAYVTGRGYPKFAGAPTATNLYPTTADGNIIWMNSGKPLHWLPSTSYQLYNCIIDTNQNLQMTNSGGTSGATPPASWATATGSSTTDGGVTWVCIGPGVTITTASVQYAFSTHAVDGSVSSASPTATIQGPILGKPTGPYLQLGGFATGLQQLDQYWIWRTPQGQSQLVFEDAIPIDGGFLAYKEFGVPDISSNGSGALNPFISAPVAHSNDAPPANMTGFAYHLQRIWGFRGNTVSWSGGPDTVTGNGNTAWPPLNSFTFQALVVRLLPITVQNGALLVFTTSGIKIILGTGTLNNPFYATSFVEKINLANYNAMDVLGTEIFLMESNLKVSTLRIEYPFDPQSGYAEIGFPIGDQFLKVTTGGYSAPLFSAAGTFLSWNIQSTKETAMYVADGNVGWFRLSAVNPPESGWIWTPFAAITNGTSAVQSVETSPGVFNLLMGPATAGPIRMRDSTGTVWTDVGTPYPSWDAKGVNLLCATGQWSEVAHISAKSMAVGARPAVSVLLGEINPSTERPWNVLEVTSPDPPSTPRSKSVFSDRYALAQNGVADEGDCILTKFDYGMQAFGDELLDWGIFATTEDERKEEAQK